MSAASKVFVVLLAVFSIAFVMLTISHVAQETKWKELANDYRTEAQTAIANYQAMLASNAAEKLALNQKLEELLRSKRDVEAQLQQVLVDLADARADAQMAKRRNESNDSALTKLAGELDVINTEASELRRQRNELEKANLNLQRRNIDMGERVRELTVQTTTMAQQIRHMQQLNFAKDEELRRVQGGEATPAAAGFTIGPATDAARPVSMIGEGPIKTSITRVDGDLASIGIGAADRVRVGMRFVIHQNDNYLGDLLITATEPNEAVGTLENVQGTINPGNQAVSLTGLASSY